MEIVLSERGRDVWHVGRPQRTTDSEILQTAQPSSSTSSSIPRPRLSFGRRRLLFKPRSSKFKFQGLPNELKLRILEAALISYEPIVDLKRDKHINLAILRTCHWIHEEGIKIFYTHNHFYFTRPEVLLQRLEKEEARALSRTAAMLQNVQHLSLDILIAKKCHPKFLFLNTVVNIRQTLRTRRLQKVVRLRVDHWVILLQVCRKMMKRVRGMYRFSEAHQLTVSRPAPFHTLTVHLRGVDAFIEGWSVYSNNLPLPMMQSPEWLLCHFSVPVYYILRVAFFKTLRVTGLQGKGTCKLFEKALLLEAFTYSPIGDWGTVRFQLSRRQRTMRLLPREIEGDENGEGDTTMTDG